MQEFLTPTYFLIAVLALAVSLLMATRLAKNPEEGAILIAFFLPFERIPSLDIGGFTFKINHLIGGLTFLFWILAVLFAKRKIAPNFISFPLIILGFSFLISGMGAVNSGRHISVSLALLIMVAIYLAVVNSLINKTVVQRVIIALLAGAGLMSIVGLYQFAGDIIGLPTSLTGLDPGYTKVVFSFPRVHAFSKEPLYYANFLFIPLGVGLALFFAKIKPVVKHWSHAITGSWLIPVLALIIINFFLTLSRGAFLSLVPFAAIFIFFYARHLLTIRNFLIGGLTLIVALSAVYGVLRLASPEALERFIDHAALQDVLVQKTGESGFGRLHTFKQAIEAWQTNPDFGIGLGNFGPHILNYPQTAPPTGWQIVNNEYLELLAETGAVGLFLWLLILILVFGRSIIAYKRAEDPYLQAVLVGLMAAGMAIATQYNFFSTLYIIHIWVLLGLTVGVQNLIFTSKTSKVA